MKHKHNKNKRLYQLMVMGALLLVFLVGMTVTVVTVKSSNKKELEMSYDWSIDDPSDQSIYVKATPGAAWEDGNVVGNQYDFVIYNNSKYTITDWKVTVNVPEGSDLENYWNGFWAITGDGLTYEPANFNVTVEPGGQRSFGVVMRSSEVASMNEISLTYHKARRVTTAYPFWIFSVLAMIDAIVIVVVHIVDIKMANYEKTHAAYKDQLSESLRTIANIIDTKDEYTKGHSVRVAIYSGMLAKRMGMSEYDQERIYHIGLLHDIGKIGIPAAILTKPGRLNDEEFETIKKHPALGAQIMKDFASIPGVVNGIRYHHERYDGKGYNDGLKGEEIPIEGRIICVADSYDAMSSKRCYRNALSYDFIMNELKRNSGVQFDPEIVKHMIALVEEGYAPVSDEEMEEYEI